MAKYKIIKEVLEKLYLKENFSITDISNKIGCSRNNIFYYLKKFDIKKKRSSHNFKNLSGMKFGKLLVIKRDEILRLNNTVYWICECSCGEKTVVRASHLVGRKIQSCGCSQFDCHWKGCGEISGEKWNSIKQCGSSRNLNFTITIEEIWELFLKQNRKCAISGIELCFSTHWKGEQTASLDRIDSSRGYELENVQWVHKTINKIKNNLNDQEFIKWCKTVSDYNR